MTALTKTNLIDWLDEIKKADPEDNCQWMAEAALNGYTVRQMWEGIIPTDIVASDTSVMRSSPRVLIFENDYALYISDVWSRGNVIGGVVENGGWYMLYDLNTSKMYSGKTVADMNEKNFIREHKIVWETPIDSRIVEKWATENGYDFGMFYNAVIDWARDDKAKWQNV